MWKWLKRVFPSEHEWVAQQLSAYLDNELSPPDRTRVEAHLKECRTCVEELSTLRWTVNLTAQMPMLRAPRSFLIAEAVAQPRRASLSGAYVYLRGATVAVAALLLVALASDFLWPHPPPPAIPVPRMVMRKALPAVEEVPVETVVEKEVMVEKEVEKPVLPKARVPLVEKEVVKALAATPTPEEEAAKMDLKAKQVAPQAERVSKEEMGQEPLIATAPPAERAPETALGPVGSGGGAEQEMLEEKKLVASVVVPPTPTSERAVPTSTPPSPHRIVAEVVPSPQLTSLPPAAAVAEITEPTGGLFSWRSALRLTEMGLGLLMVLLVGSTLVIRLRHR